MLYWKYLKSVSFGSSDSYVTDSRRIRIDSDWQNNDFPSFSQLNSMLSDIQYNGSQDEIAALCFAAGISVEMDYTYYEGSGAYVSLTDNAFRNKFGYSSATYSGGWSGVNLDAVKSNIQEKKPVLLGIEKSYGRDGHAIVANGYKSSGEYHLNFGWGSDNPDPSYQAWYFLPSGMPDGFSVVDEAILDITPPAVAAKELTSVSISGISSVNGNSYADYTLTAYFSDGTSQNVTSSATWSENSSYAYFDSYTKGRLRTYSITSDTSVPIYASYTYGGITKSTTKLVTIKNGKTLSYVSISGSSTVNESSYGNYTLTAYTIKNDQPVTVLSSVSISGSSTVNENSYADYTLTAYFTDGTSSTVTSSAIWSEYSSYAYFDSSYKGRLRTYSVSSNKSVTIYASYTEGGVTKSTTKSVTIQKSATASLTIINNYYFTQEVYLDNVYIGNVSVSQTRTWYISPGYHTVAVCDPGGTNCLYRSRDVTAGYVWTIEVYSKRRNSDDKSVSDTLDTEVNL